MTSAEKYTLCEEKLLSCSHVLRETEDLAVDATTAHHDLGSIRTHKLTGSDKQFTNNSYDGNGTCRGGVSMGSSPPRLI